MRILILALAMALCATASAQDMNKCKNAAGKVTYTSKECRDLGLTSAGTVSGRTGEAPAASSVSSAKPNSLAAPGAANPPGKRCLTVKRGKGDITTLCDDELKTYESKPRTL